MAEKTVKVDEAVHQRLEELKREYGVETFNEVLRHELDIISKPEVDELAAFLQEDVKETVQSVVETIRGIGQFDEEVTEERNREVLEFISTKSGRVVSRISFDERYFQVQYRGQNGEMKDCGRGWYSSNSENPKFGRHRDTHDHTEPSDVIEQVETKVTGAYERWGK
ncbi:hypothetical protein SAMN05216226_1148 [Halovenus aranensis]|uniref:Uncharacterized protein n=1 Tax=Halovenus aranensis TaxID=890420 RepID=A0A1G8YB31_9EURY|nr:hypothetical protein [Halovenus aranensis]SDJ99931.1 hypothetical protein SAMN05216226_1148 [Halovenus aranensis]